MGSQSVDMLEHAHTVCVTRLGSMILPMIDIVILGLSLKKAVRRRLCPRANNW